jgi:DNA mismatch repair protein MutL
MALVKIMDVALSAKVSAGEVITRPVNAVKELVENALDAGAQAVTVELMNGGKRKILVCDDGCGMGHDDLELCVQNHATSKISQLEDFNSLCTFGFRGEALPSMGAVSRLVIETRTPEAEHGLRKEIIGGVSHDIIPCAAGVGTRVEIRDLFYNIPARLKFLKSDQYEKSLVTELIQSFMAVFKDCSFQFLHNGERVLFSSGKGEEAEILGELVGQSHLGSLFKIPQSSHPILGMKISGHLSRPDLTRSSPRFLRVFVNRRIVKHSRVNRAILNAYDSFLPQGKWPVGILYIEIPPRMLDVNVHPMKTEVRIENQSILEEFITKRIRSLLLKEDLSPALVPSYPKKPRTPPGFSSPQVPLLTRSDNGTSDALEQNSKRIPKTPSLRVHEQPETLSIGSGITLRLPSEDRQELESPQKLALNQPHSESLSQNCGQEPTFSLKNIQVIGQLDDTFILGQILNEPDESLVIVDQHVAQERILYERYLKALKQKAHLNRRKLLIPVSIKLDSGLLSTLDLADSSLESLGFELEVSGKNLKILTIPDLFEGELTEDFFETLVSGYERNFASNHLEDYFQGIAATMACKGSVRAGDPLGIGEAQILVDTLADCENPNRCPHGRPIVVKFSLREICKRFHRPYRPPKS